MKTNLIRTQAQLLAVGLISAACIRPGFNCMQIVSYTITSYEVKEDLRVKTDVTCKLDLGRKFTVVKYSKAKKYRKPFDDKILIPCERSPASVWICDEKS